MLRSSIPTITAFRAASAVLCVLAALLASSACAPSAGSLVERELVKQLGADAKTVKVKLDGTTATLSGAVRERSTRVLSAEVALAQPGVATVNNQLKAPERKPLERMYMEYVDNNLLFQVEFFVLRRVGGAAVKDLTVHAVEGTVSLRGPVASEELRKTIVKTVSEVEDVRKVVDLMTVADERAKRGSAKPQAVTPEPAKPVEPR